MNTRQISSLLIKPYLHHELRTGRLKLLKSKLGKNTLHLLPSWYLPKLFYDELRGQILSKTSRVFEYV